MFPDQAVAELSAVKGDNATVSARISSFPRPEVKWHLNNDLVLLPDQSSPDGKVQALEKCLLSTTFRQVPRRAGQDCGGQPVPHPPQHQGGRPGREGLAC